MKLPITIIQNGTTVSYKNYGYGKREIRTGIVVGYIPRGMSPHNMLRALPFGIMQPTLIKTTHKYDRYIVAVKEGGEINYYGPFAKVVEKAYNAETVKSKVLPDGQHSTNHGPYMPKSNT